MVPPALPDAKGVFVKAPVLLSEGTVLFLMMIVLKIVQSRKTASPLKFPSKVRSMTLSPLLDLNALPSTPVNPRQTMVTGLEVDPLS